MSIYNKKGYGGGLKNKYRPPKSDGFFGGSFLESNTSRKKGTTTVQVGALGVKSGQPINASLKTF